TYPLRSYLSPYPTLFRSCRAVVARFPHPKLLPIVPIPQLPRWPISLSLRQIESASSIVSNRLSAARSPPPSAQERSARVSHPNRSEEHTSELQSRGHLVC